jgi:uncharacterized protein YkwD
MREIFTFLLKQLSLLNIIDWLIISATLIYALEGYITGFIVSLLDISTFILSFITGFLLYRITGGFFIRLFKGPEGIIYTISFILIAVTAEIIFRILVSKLIKKFHKTPLSQNEIFKEVNGILGIIPGVLSSFLLITFFLITIVTFPFSQNLKKIVTDSYFANTFIGQAQNLEKLLLSSLGQNNSPLLTFTTVPEEDKGSIDLHFTYANGKEDKYSEDIMLLMINAQRTSRNLPALVANKKLAEVALSHAQDMLKKGYFSHFSLNGKSPFDRMNDANVVYLYAGENLALSPNVSLAMQGLMGSIGHRENILSTNFYHVGIGVIDAGIYGEMFVQEFTD